MEPRFKLRHAVVGYIVALVFALNWLLAGVLDATVASGGESFALITCLGGQAPGQQLPGQSDHASKCSCSLSSCCCAGSLARNATETGIAHSVADAAALQHTPNLVERDFRTDHPLHLWSPPVVTA